jgi:hypothetical protein
MVTTHCILNGTWCPEMGYGRLNAYKALQNSFNYSSLNDMTTEPFVHIFPNPAQSSIQVIVPPMQFVEIKISDVSGRVLLIEKAEKERIVLDITGLPNGMYTVQLNVANRRYARQLAVVR